MIKRVNCSVCKSSDLSRRKGDLLTAEKRNGAVARSAPIFVDAKRKPTEEDNAVYEAKLADDYIAEDRGTKSIFDIYKNNYKAPAGLYFDVAA